MSLDARMRVIAREEIATAPGSDVSELRQKIDDLHEELHAVVTGVKTLQNLIAEDSVRLNALERQTELKTGDTAQPEAAPAARRTRKATTE